MDVEQFPHRSVPQPKGRHCSLNRRAETRPDTSPTRVLTGCRHNSTLVARHHPRSTPAPMVRLSDPPEYEREHLLAKNGATLGRTPWVAPAKPLSKMPWQAKA